MRDMEGKISDKLTEVTGNLQVFLLIASHRPL